MHGASGLAEELKDITDAHERRKAQNRIAQRRRRQRLRQDAKTVGVDVAEIAGFENNDLSLLGSDLDFSLSGVPGPGWTQNSTLDTDSGFMDLDLTEDLELDDLDGLHDSPLGAHEDRSLHKRLVRSMSDQYRRHNIPPGGSPMMDPLKRGLRETKQARSKHSDVAAHDKCQHRPQGQKLHLSDCDFKPRSDEPSSMSPVGGFKTGTIATDPRRGNSSNLIYRRTWSESHDHNYHRRPDGAIQRLSSTPSCRCPSFSDSSSQLSDDWETQRSPIASTLTQRSKKLATDLMKLYELGVYLEIQSKDTELEDLLSEVKRRFAVLDRQAEQSNRFTSERAGDFQGKSVTLNQA